MNKCSFLGHNSKAETIPIEKIETILKGLGITPPQFLKPIPIKRCVRCKKWSYAFENNYIEGVI